MKPMAYLSVRKQENSMVFCLCSFTKNSFQILSPFTRSVALCNLNLENDMTTRRNVMKICPKRNTDFSLCSFLQEKKQLSIKYVIILWCYC